jgi:hypothetical protein
LPKSKALDALLPDNEPFATFHDAVISSVQVDYLRRRFVAHMQINCGDPDSDGDAARERWRDGELIVEALKVWSIEPPALTGSDIGHGLWLASDGVLSDAPTEIGRALARQLAPGHVAWFLFFNNLNAFGYLAGERAEFRWR